MPESTLSSLRELLYKIKHRGGMLPTEWLLAMELFERLDDRLSDGEHYRLPMDWSMAQRSRHLNGCPIEPGWARPAEPDLEDAVEV